MGIQFYLSFTYENITIPLGIGICFQIPSILISASKYSILYPWSYSTTVNNITALNSTILIKIIISILIFILAVMLAYKKFNNKDIY